jgi:TonB family protein
MSAMKPHYLLLAVAVLTVHVAAIYEIDHSVARAPTTVREGRIQIIFVQPTIQDKMIKVEPNLSRITLSMVEPQNDIHLQHPEIDFEVGRNSGALAVAPSLKPNPDIDMSLYIKQASLQIGEGATVILRIEVLETGLPGEIEVDTSSGSTQIDQAAVSYARTQSWYAGRRGGLPHTVWIRWGVRLQS